MRPRDPAEARVLVVLPALQSVLVVLALLLDDRLPLHLILTGPLFAAVLLTPRQTMAVGAWTVLMCAIGGLVPDADRTDGLVTVAVAGVLGVLGVLLTQERAERERELASVTRVAEIAQTAILRPLPERVGPMQFAAAYQSASREAHVGGDLYGLVEIDGRLRLMIGDVRGKGLPAIGLAADVLAAFRQSAGRYLELAEVAYFLESAVRRLGADEEFVTALLLELNTDGVSLVNLGHPEPILRNADGARLLRGGQSPPLGLGVQPVTTSHRLGHGDQIILFTDGLTEARDARGEFFDALAAVEDGPSGGPRVLVDHLLTAVDAHVGRALQDDLALIVVERDGEQEADPPRPRTEPAQAGTGVGGTGVGDTGSPDGAGASGAGASGAVRDATTSAG